MNPTNPTSADIIVGTLVVLAGCLGAAVSVDLARRTRNWLYLLVALGCAALVAGVVGQRHFPSDDTVARLGAEAASRASPGPWEAGVSIPVVGLRATPVALAGLLLALAGLALVLFFEPVPADEPVGTPVAPRLLEEDDLV